MKTAWLPLRLYCTSFLCINVVFSSTVHGLQGRVDSLEKSNSKLIEEVRQASENESMGHSFLEVLILTPPVISTESPHLPVRLYVNNLVFLSVKVILYNLDVLNIADAFLRNTPGLQCFTGDRLESSTGCWCLAALY